LTPRLERDRQCVLILIGADAGGKKELLAIDDGFRESEQSWHELLVHLRDENGLVIDPELATGDGALGFWKAAKKVWPNVKQQRCWVHKTANVLNDRTTCPSQWRTIEGLLRDAPASRGLIDGEQNRS
jgi:putative transposase